MRMLILISSMMALLVAHYAQAEICKWVDDEGVTHFSKYCPDDVEGDEVVIEEGPTEQQTNSTKQNAQRLYEKRSTRRDAEEQKSEERAREARKERADASRRSSLCRQAVRHLGILTTQRPVFFDNRNRLHHDREGFAYTYEGPRRYVEDAERAQLIQQWTATQAENCDQ